MADRFGAKPAFCEQKGMTAEGSRAADRLCKNGFERTYVRERQWLTPGEYGGLVALCHMVPGRASSQVSYLIGLRRAGWSGAFAAWAGFTLPSATAPLQPARRNPIK